MFGGVLLASKSFVVFERVFYHQGEFGRGLESFGASGRGSSAWENFGAYRQAMTL